MLESIPYLENSTTLFAKFAHEPWAMYLDSCQLNSEQACYDIIALRPEITLQTQNGVTKIIHSNGSKQSSRENPFDVIKRFLKPNPKSPKQLPFSGGAMGYFSYDLGRTLERLPNLCKNDCPLPELQLGIYSKVIIFDHSEKAAWFLNDGTLSFSELLKTCSKPSQQKEEFKLESEFVSNMSKEQYNEAFNTIKNYIKAGDCYQVNLSQRFEAAYTGSTWDAYLKLRTANPAPYAAYLNLPDTTVLSFSPEQFVACHDQKVITRPIKGTRPRSKNAAQDEQLKFELQNSEKDKAENLMIVDLLRNDLGKVCEYGSIHVPKLFNLESFENVHHLVSTIVGYLKLHYSSIDLLKACFPGGSVTGTPKIRAMEIIEELEPHRRNIYCGSIGYINHNGKMDTSISIRTLYTHAGKIYCSAGGALVADSECDSEYQECFDKVKVLLDNLNY